MKAELENYLKDVKMPESIRKSPLRFCTICTTVWEYYWDMGRGQGFAKYAELCSYEIQRETCADCENKDE